MDKKVSSVSMKVAAWQQASELVEPIVDKHGLALYTVGPNIFAPTTKMTPSDQHITHIMNVADWLLDE